MDSFDIKVEKANAMFRYRRLQKITTLFRFMEFFVFLIMISKFSSQLPNLPLVEYFRGLSVVVFSPRFVFIIGNVIIIILFFKSGHLLGNSVDKVDFYDEYVQHCETNASVVIRSEERKIYRSRYENLTREKHEEITHHKLRRTVTERNSISFDCGEKTGKEVIKAYAEDELSSEEFRRTVEAFIAKQQKSLRDEEFSPMVYFGA